MLARARWCTPFGPKPALHPQCIWSPVGRSRGRRPLDILAIVLLLATGLVAGIGNVLAGGGSLLSVPLLVFLGLPGDVANGTNRIGILVQNATAMRGFRRERIPGLRAALPLLLPAGLGSLLGAAAIAQLDPSRFERIFGVVMLLMLVPMLRATTRKRDTSGPPPVPWPPALRFMVFFVIGLYGGALQAGVGFFLLFALSHSTRDLVEANSIKVAVVGFLTLISVPVFLLNGQVALWPAVVLSIGFALGGTLGARLATRGGERLIRPVLVVAVLALAGRMLALY